jgi:cytochrome c oxidase assembly factor CtaG
VSEPQLPPAERFALGTLVWRFPQVHLAIGVVGNVLFVLGSVLFMTERQDPGVVCFLAGSTGMLLGAVGESVRVLGKRRLARFDVDPYNPDERWSETQRRSSPLE